MRNVVQSEHVKEYSTTSILEMKNSCACLQARHEAQFLTKEYDKMLAPSGLKLTQFSTIAVLLAGPSSITKLAQALKLDRTTLSRNLTVLEKKDCVHLSKSEDARERQVALTPNGTKAAHMAYGLWQQAQALYARPN